MNETLDFSPGWFDRLINRIAEWHCPVCEHVVVRSVRDPHPACPDCSTPLTILGWDEPMEGDES